MEILRITDSLFLILRDVFFSTLLFVQTQAKLYCMAGHPLCALHILKSTGHALNPQAAGLLLKTLSLTRSDDDTSVDLVIESIIQESIHSLFKQS